MLLVLVFDLGVAPALVQATPADVALSLNQDESALLACRYCEECRQTIERPPAASEGLWPSGLTVPTLVIFPSGFREATDSPPGLVGVELLYQLMSLQR
jgi:hypothetical protein